MIIAYRSSIVLETDGLRYIHKGVWITMAKLNEQFDKRRRLVERGEWLVQADRNAGATPQVRP